VQSQVKPQKDLLRYETSDHIHAALYQYSCILQSWNLASIFFSRKANDNTLSLNALNKALITSPANRQFDIPHITKETRADFADYSYRRERLRPNPEFVKLLHISSLNSMSSLLGSRSKTRTDPSSLKHVSLSSSIE
jgi:hypothetical protein